MSKGQSSVPFLCVGRLKEVSLSVEKALSPQIAFNAIIDLASFSPEAVRSVLKSLNPTPAGVLVGGGVTSEVQQEVEKAVQEFNETANASVKYIATPIGLREEIGPEGHLQYFKDKISQEVGVTY